MTYNINPSVDPQYVSLLEIIMTCGKNRTDRTEVGTVSTFGQQLVVNIEDYAIPALGVRKVSPRIAFEELMFMLNGKSQTKELEEKNIKIWSGNTSRDFLDNRGLYNLNEGDFGRMYGVQLRSFTGFVDTDNGIHRRITFDQLQYIVNEIQNNPTSRRIITTHYNPAEAHLGALFPCHIMTQVVCDPDSKTLELLFWMRSSDVGFGLPYNLMYYAMFAHLLAELTGYKATRLVYQAGDCHLYTNQITSGMIDYMISNMDNSRAGRTIPKMVIRQKINTLEDMLNIQWGDIDIINYTPFPDFKNKPSMAI